jgi:hypothetical protein
VPTCWTLTRLHPELLVYFDRDGVTGRLCGCTFYGMQMAHAGVHATRRFTHSNWLELTSQARAESLFRAEAQRRDHDVGDDTLLLTTGCGS